MDIISEHIKVVKTARYFLTGVKPQSASQIWLVMHGYGYTVSEFIALFRPLLDGKTAIVAPEGLSRFYTKGLGGKVGASWMTKEDRLQEIEDYTFYLGELMNRIIPPFSSSILHVYGFSQGVSTLSRVLSRLKWVPASFHACCGEMAADADWEYLTKLSADIPFHLYFGREDKLVPLEWVEKKRKLLPEEFKYQYHLFNGGHDVTMPILQ